MPESVQVPFRSYEVTFSTVGLQGKPGVKDLRDCVFSATAEPRILLFDPQAVARAADLQVMRPTPSDPNTVAVLVSEKQPNGSLKAVQRAFHLIAAC